MAKYSDSISPNMVKTLQDMKARVDSGEETDQNIIEAIEAIDMAGRVVNTIMSGNQIDPVFFKQLQTVTSNKISLSKNKPERTRVRKKRKFKIKA